MAENNIPYGLSQSPDVSEEDEAKLNLIAQQMEDVLNTGNGTLPEDFDPNSIFHQMEVEELTEEQLNEQIDSVADEFNVKTIEDRLSQVRKSITENSNVIERLKKRNEEIIKLLTDMTEDFERRSKMYEDEIQHNKSLIDMNYNTWVSLTKQMRVIERTYDTLKTDPELLRTTVLSSLEKELQVVKDKDTRVFTWAHEGDDPVVMVHDFGEDTSGESNDNVAGSD